MADKSNMGRRLSVPAARETKNVMGQVGQSFDAGSKALGTAMRGSPEEAPLSSLQFNPAKVQEREKFDIMQDFILRARSNTAYLINDLLGTRIPALVTSLGTQGAPLALLPAMAANMLKTTGTILGLKAEMSSARTMLKDLMVNGWKLTRTSEPVAYSSKAFFVKAESIAQIEAPVVITSGSAISQQGHIVNTLADLHTVTCREELHRISSVYGIDAQFLTALVQVAATIKSVGNIEIAANGDVTLSSIGTMNLKAGGAMNINAGGAINIGSVGVTKISAGGALDLGATGAVSVQAGVALTMHGVASATLSSTGVSSVTGIVGAMPFPMFTPIPPLRPDLLIPPVFLPPTPVVPPAPFLALESPTASEALPQTQGMGSVGGQIF